MAGIRLATPMKEIPEEKIHAYYNLCRNLNAYHREQSLRKCTGIRRRRGCTGNKAYYGIKDLPRGLFCGGDPGRGWPMRGL